MKPRFKQLIFPMIGVILVSAFPAVFLYCQNADEAGFEEIAPILLAFVGMGIALFLVFSVPTRSFEKACIFASLLALVLINFTFIEDVLKRLFPALKYWHTVPIIIVVCLHVAYFICRFIPKDLIGDAIKVVCVVFGFLLVFNFATAAPQIINYAQMQRQIEEAQKEREGQLTKTISGQPNVYFIILDEYGNFPQMEEYYHYDNAPLKDFLEGHNFAISYDSHNESIYSNTIQTNWINLDYIVDDYTSVSEKSFLTKNGVMFDVMRDQGYDVQIFEAGNSYGGHMPDATTSSSAVTIGGETLRDILLQRTIAYPFCSTHAVSQNLQYINLLRYFHSPESLPTESTFTLIYDCFPHPPFLVDENGNGTPAEHREDWADPKYYLGQFKYATKLTLGVLDNIIKNDPSSIIILQSDHGGRALEDDRVDFPLEMINSPLNAIYYQGQVKLEIEGLSSVNTLRLLLNHLFDMDYEMLEVPEYTLDD